MRRSEEIWEECPSRIRQWYNSSLGYGFTGSGYSREEGLRPRYATLSISLQDRHLGSSSVLVHSDEEDDSKINILFYDYEDWKVIKALEEKITNGDLQVFCVDSVDLESFYNSFSHPGYRIYRHIQYEKYVLEEVLPLANKINTNPNVISAGCSLGAYHAVNVAMRHPNLFCKVVGMSGRYDLTKSKGYFKDLLSGFHNDFVYFNMPNQYLKNLEEFNF